MRKTILLLLFTICFGTMMAQIRIPEANFAFELPKGWKYLSTTKVDAKTKVYLYSTNEIILNGDTVLPHLRVYVKQNYRNKTAMEMSLDRFMAQPYQTLEEYTEGLFLPTQDAIAYLGKNRDEEDGTENKFYTVYFIHKSSGVEFRLSTTEATFELMKEEFEIILKSVVVY